LFNKIRFENKINIKMWGSFEILESYVGERVNKIRFDGNINKEIRFRVVSTYNSVFGRKREKRQEERRDQESCDFLQTKVRVSLAYNYIKL